MSTSSYAGLPAGDRNGARSRNVAVGRAPAPTSPIPHVTESLNGSILPPPVPATVQPGGMAATSRTSLASSRTRAARFTVTTAPGSTLRRPTVGASAVRARVPRTTTGVGVGVGSGVGVGVGSGVGVGVGSGVGVGVGSGSGRARAG